MNIKSIVFDLYGTLYDVHSVEIACEKVFPGHGLKIAEMWRKKQIEYTWLRSVMDDYRHFEKVTEDALWVTCAQLGLELDVHTHRVLSDAYLCIAPHADALPALTRLYRANIPMGIVSNGSRHSIDSVVHHSSMEWAFKELISVEELEIFKPHPSVYSLAEQRMREARKNILFVSSNAWDAAAAGHFGFPTCWNNRLSAPFEKLGSLPTYTTKHLGQMADLVLAPR